MQDLSKHSSEFILQKILQNTTPRNKLTNLKPNCEQEISSP